MTDVKGIKRTLVKVPSLPSKIERNSFVKVKEYLLSIEVMEITDHLLIEACGDRAYERGKNYFRQGRVLHLHQEPVNEKQYVIRATNRGRGGRLYEQEIDIFRLDQELLLLEGECSCPVGYNCKHVVAACLAAVEERAKSSDSAGRGDFDQWLTGLTPPKGAGVASELEKSKEYLIYELMPEARGDWIEVGFAIARLKRDGLFGKGRHTSLPSFTNYIDDFVNSYTITPSYLRQEDREIVSLLRASGMNIRGGVFLKGAAGSLALKLMLETGRAFWGESREKPLSAVPPREISLCWKEEGRQFQLNIDTPEGLYLLPVEPPLFIDVHRQEVGELILPAGIDSEWLRHLASAPPLLRKEAKRTSRWLALNHPELPTPLPVEITDIGQSVPTPRLTLGQALATPLQTPMTLDFLYEGVAVDGERVERVVTVEQGNSLLRFQRDLEVETGSVERLRQEGLIDQPGSSMHFTLPGSESGHQADLAAWFQFAETGLKRLQEEGWLIEQDTPSQIRLSRAERIEAEVDRTEIDWFELRFDLEVEGRLLPLLPLVSELIGEYEPGSLPPSLYFPCGEGHYVEVLSERIEPILQTLIELYDNLGEGGELHLSRLDAPLLQEFGDLKIRGGAELKRLAAKLRNFDGIKPAKLPTTFKGELRSYQQQGLDWLQFLREYELAGILADDMGLGKTVQTLAHLAIEKRSGRMRHPSLIIAPTSLMGNWRREARLFTPKLRVVVLQGPDRHIHFDDLHAQDLILTTYPLLPRDREVLLQQTYHCLILDEAQQIKNPRSQAARLVREIEAKHRLCLTGTPMENHLGELWAQFDFLLPGFLGSREQFTRNYRNPIEQQGDQQRLQRLSRRIEPFMLRRVKEQVAKELPQKSELQRITPLEGRQAALYESIRLSMEKKVRDAITKRGVARSQITILDALLKLRQVCCDPRLLSLKKRQSQVPSAKLSMLLEMVPELLDEGRRILLFSQFTSMLGLIEQALKKVDIPYCKLTGQTRKREQAIDAFRNGEVNLFLISLKAGGVGLNLIEADTVIHYDPWWNPAVEAQATDRAHRIGQDKPVFVYKLLTEGTVEEKILALQEKKRKLADSVYGKGKKGGELLFDAETIEELLAG
jgi:superfamily II DNA or RNA helicase